MNEQSRPTPASEGRRLAAIVFTDVAGYSALMQRDEPSTLAAVRDDFTRMTAGCARHGGEKLNSMGDGLLLCFPSVVQAVEWALQVQAEFGARGPASLRHRIGIHLGDVFREAGQVAGDGVNIAARLQACARPGTVCVSQSVYDAVRGKVAMQVEPLGQQRLKNIAEPVPAYLVLPSDGAPPAAPSPRRRWRRLVIPTLAGAATALALSYFWPRPAPAPAVPAPAAAAPVGNAPATVNSIAVLPFTNMSEEKDTAYFADGVQEDLLTSLANLRTLKVISRTSVMQYRGTTKTIRQIAAELGVAYILEGSVRRAGHQVRVTSQLINARTDEHLWARSYDDDLTDIFAIQAKLSREIADALSAVLSPHESARLESRSTRNLVAYDAYLKARSLANSFYADDAANAAAERDLREALKADPRYVAGWAELATLYIMDAFYDHGVRAERLALAREAIETARRLDPEAPEVLLGQGDYYFFGFRDYAQASAYYRQVVAAYPNRSEPYRSLALVARRQGRWQDCLGFLRKGRELDPRNLDILTTLMTTLFMGQRLEECSALARDILQINPQSLDAQIILHLAGHFARGDLREFEEWQASFPPALRDSREGQRVRFDWACESGNLERALQLKEKLGFDATDGPLAHALLLQGDRTRGEAVLRLVQARAEEDIRRNPDSADAWFHAASCRAAAGDRPGTLAAIDRARQLLPESLDVLNGLEVSMRCAQARAMLGDKEEALAEIRRLIRQPSADLTVAGLRTSLDWRSLQGDPRLEAILQDPANNTPRF